MKKNKKIKYQFKLIGYYSNASHPEILNDFLIERIDNGSAFRASVLEAQKLYSQGLLDTNIGEC